MKTTNPKLIIKSLKPYVCDWCGEMIEKRTQYYRWFTYGDFVTARMHPECYKAQCRADFQGEELPPRGTFRRGCWCGENLNYCKCGE